jgi:cellulose synthase/poly-beta-1,6-N-acetylglucosamine synthase-like glycosyltransferase
MKAAYLASAELAIETQNMYATMGLTLLSVASIMIGLVMLKGVFGKHIGYVAIVAGVLSLFSPFGVMLGIPVIIPFIGLVLMAVWQIVVGAKLYKLSKDV